MLVNSILKETYFLIIETNGTLYRKSIRKDPNIYVVCSPKPDTNYYLNEKLKPYVKEIKLVVDDNLSIDVIRKFSEFPIILQPEGNKQIFMEKALDLQRKSLDFNIEVRVIPQIHKCFNLR
jgi:organic radical activating enzyme